MFLQIHIFKARSAFYKRLSHSFLPSVFCVLSVRHVFLKYCILHFLCGKTLPLFLSDISLHKILYLFDHHLDCDLFFWFFCYFISDFDFFECNALLLHVAICSTYKFLSYIFYLFIILHLFNFCNYLLRALLTFANLFVINSIFARLSLKFLNPNLDVPLGLTIISWYQMTKKPFLAQKIVFIKNECFYSDLHPKID